MILIRPLITVITLIFYATLISSYVHIPYFDNLIDAASMFTFTISVILFYAGYSTLTNTVPKSKRYLWGWLILFGNFATIPFFWYFYIWKSK